jgi:alpha-beta hydrolase superfamily lysophospholipase
MIWLLMTAATACAPRVQTFGPPAGTARLDAHVFVSADGRRLPYEVWEPEAEPKAAIVALHGFNDYRTAFAGAAQWWAERGVVTYAYDQRGFGEAPERGIWAGSAALASDARAFVKLAQARHPGLPVYLLGDSMGGAVALLALAGEDAPDVAGGILVAPAVWGGRAMNPAFRFGIWFAAHTTPWNYATGQGLRRMPSDNIEMLRRLGRDPLVIKQTRIDAVYGLTQLMGEALEASPEIKAPLLVLYGQRDEIVPSEPVAELVSALDAPHRVAFYSEGYHMLLRDLQRETVWRDVASWIADPAAPLPSGEERGHTRSARAGDPS